MEGVVSNTPASSHFQVYVIISRLIHVSINSMNYISQDKGWSFQCTLYLDLRPGSRLGQGVNSLSCQCQNLHQGQGSVTRRFAKC